MSPHLGFGPSRRRPMGVAPLAAYAWALDFKAGQYRNGSQLVGSVTSLTGCNFARTGAVNEQIPGGAVHGFASGIPAIVPGHGYVQRPAHTNLLLNAGQNAVLATQDISMTSGASYTLSFIGTGSVTISGAASGTLAGTGANERVRLTITASTTGAATVTVTGDARWAVLVAQTTQGPIIETGASSATAPAGDLWFAAPDLSGDWLLLAEFNFLETATATVTEEAVLAVNDGSTANRIQLSRAIGGQLRARYNLAGGSTTTAVSLSNQPGAGRCILGLRKSGTTYAMGAIVTGGSYTAGALGTLSGRSATFSRIDVGKQLSANISHGLIRFVGLETGTFTDPQMQAKLEARL